MRTYENTESYSSWTFQPIVGFGIFTSTEVYGYAPQVYCYFIRRRALSPSLGLGTKLCFVLWYRDYAATPGAEHLWIEPNVKYGTVAKN